MTTPQPATPPGADPTDPGPATGHASLAMGLELLGFIGLLGLGWASAGFVVGGLLLLLAWWAIIALAVVGAAVAGFFAPALGRGLPIGLLVVFTLAWLLVPTISTLGLRRHRRRRRS